MVRRLRHDRLTLLCAAVLLAVNVWVAHRLFFLNFSNHMDSIEGPYMAISRWAAMHWGDLKWFPLWYTGMPFDHVYQPGLHLTVAAFSTLLRQPVQHVYHFVTALAYCLTPVFLFVLCFVASGSRAFAFIAGLLLSLLSPVALLVPAFAHDTGGWLHPRRLWILVKYGEGPHTTAVMLIPLAILFLHRAVAQRRPYAFPLASLALAAVVITNWPGSIGLSLAVVAYCVSRVGERPAIHWPTFAGVCIAAYLLVCPWIPPSVVVAVQRNAKQADYPVPVSRQALGAIAILIALALIQLAFRRLRADPWLRFFVYFFVVSGALVLGWAWFDIRLMPQTWRFQPEVDMAASGVIAWLAMAGFKRLRRPAFRTAAIAAFTLFCLVQIRTYTRFAHGQIGPIDVANTIEYRMSKAFERLEGPKRVFAPGNVSLWMNMFTDVPQVAGCCDQGVPTLEHRIATFIIYSGMNAGSRDAEMSTLWLKAYGANAVGVTGPHSSEPFKPFVHPEKFNGVLKELWRDGDDVIYEVPQRSASLAHVIRPADAVSRAPVNGLDVDPLEPYVHALDDPALPLASFTWIASNRARIAADVPQGDRISVQETYDSGWHATVNGVPRPVKSDALGMMLIDPGCSGNCVVDLVFDRTVERILTWIGFAAGILICIFAVVKL